MQYVMLICGNTKEDKMNSQTEKFAIEAFFNEPNNTVSEEDLDISTLTVKLISLSRFMHDPQTKVMCFNAVDCNDTPAYEIHTKMDRNIMRVLRFTETLGVAKNVNNPVEIAQLQSLIDQWEEVPPILWDDDKE